MGTEPARFDAGRCAWVGIGANLGDARATVIAAVAALKALPGTQRLVRSSLYRSAPVGATGPDYVNAVAAFDTPLAPLALLRALQAIEDRLGRERPYPNAPRTLDLDLLLHGSTVVHSAELTLPHPRMHQRAFVLRPLLELAPQLVIPGIGPARGALAGTLAQRIEPLVSP